MTVIRRLALVLALGSMVLPTAAIADGGTLSRVSVGPTGGNGDSSALYVGPWGVNGSARELDDSSTAANFWFLRTPAAEGSSAYFRTRERLVPEDTDDLWDLYRRKGTQSELVSTGPAPPPAQYGFCTASGAQLPVCTFAASRDGEHAFFGSNESLVPEDADGGYADLFERFNGTTSLSSIGPIGGDGPFEVCPSDRYPCRSSWVSADGTRVVFETAESLVTEDSSGSDLYERANGVTSLLTTGSLLHSGDGGGRPRLSDMRFGPFPVSLDGRHVFFSTEFDLEPEDADSPFRDGIDIYERVDGVTRLVSTGPFWANTSTNAFWGGASADGTRAFFTLDEALTADSALRGGIYERSGGQTRRLPLGPPSAPFDTRTTQFYGPSYDGSHVFFSTRDRITAEDTDDQWDLYAYSSDGAQLVSTGAAGGNGPFDVCAESFGPCLRAASRDGTIVYFTTREALVGGDADDACPRFIGQPYPCEDIYVRDLARGTTGLVSAGDSPADGVPFDFLMLDAISADGSRAFFRTQMSLVTQDTDGQRIDLYEHSDGRTRLISTGPAATNLATDVSFGGSTADGRLVFFDTAERLLADDTDAHPDVYGFELNEPPDCSRVTVSRPVLTTPNRALAPVTLDGATDPDGDPVTISVDGVTQDEPVRGRSDRTSPDAIDYGEGELRLRAERDPRGDGRVYRIAFTAADDHGGSCSGTATVSVPRKRNKPAVDSAPPSYDSFER